MHMPKIAGLIAAYRPICLALGKNRVFCAFTTFSLFLPSGYRTYDPVFVAWLKLLVDF